MESKLNHSSIETYSSAFAKKIANDFFIQEEVINGYQILNLTSIKQVNYFVIKILFQKWKKETSKLQSPYFDYDAKEVQSSLSDFMNVLSQHIAIKRNHFEPLLKKAVHDSVLLIFSPYDFYSKEINNPEKSRVSLSELKDAQKYIKVNRNLLDGLVARFEEDGIEEVFNDEAFALYNEVCENIKEGPEDFEPFLESLSAVVPLSLSMIYSEVEEDELREDDNASEIKNKENAAGAGKETLNVSGGIEVEDKKLAGKVGDVQKTATLGDSPLLNKIESIKKKITINQRFMFVRELFKGNVEEFNQALDRLDNMQSYDEALIYLEKDFVKRYNWNIDSEEVIEFLELLAKRYR